MGRSRFISVLAIVAGILVLSAGIVRADEPTPDQLKQQIKELQSKLDRAEIELLKSSLLKLEARVGQLEIGQAESPSPGAINAEELTVTTPAMSEPAQYPGATTNEMVTKVVGEAVVEEPVAVNQTTEELASPSQEEGVAQTEQAEAQEDAVDLPDIQDVAATTEEVADVQVLEEQSDEIAAVTTDELETSEPTLQYESVEIFVTQDNSLANVQDEPADAAPNSEVTEQSAPAMQPAAVSSVDLSASDFIDEPADELSVVQFDQELFDDRPPTAPNP